jgi:hypothetical protein
MINGNNMYAQSIGTTMQNSEGVFLKEPVPAPDLIDKTFTENGEYAASSDNADGYSKVTVDVAGGGGETFEVNGVVDTTTTPPCYRTDKTFTQVLEAFNNGANIIFNFEGDELPEFPYKYIVPIATTDHIDSLYVTKMMAPHGQFDNKLFTSGLYYNGENTMIIVSLVDVTARE